MLNLYGRGFKNYSLDTLIPLNAAIDRAERYYEDTMKGRKISRSDGAEMDESPLFST